MRVLWVVGLWLAVGSGLAQRPAPPNLPVVTKVEIKFQTGDDDKDDDSKLTVYFACNDSSFADADGSTMATLIGASKGFNFFNNQETPWAQVPVHPGAKITKNQVHDCTTTVRIDPVGHDTWRFNYLVKLRYSDGTQDDFHFNGHALSQDYRQNTYPLR